MIATDKLNKYNNNLNYVQLKDGFATYTNSFVLFKSGFLFNGDNLPEATYLHIDEWNKIQKLKGVSYISYKDGIAKFHTDAYGVVECLAKTDIDFPDTSKLKTGKSEYKASLNLSTLELLVRQMKLEKKHALDVEFFDEPLSKVVNTEHLFTRNK